MRSDFRRLSYLCKAMHDKPGSVFRVNRGQQVARLRIPASCIQLMHDLLLYSGDALVEV